MKKKSFICTKIDSLTQKSRFITISLVILFCLFYCSAGAQGWEFVKERNGIKVFTRKEPNTSLKSFKGIMDVHSTMDRVKKLIGNVHNTEWWDKNVKDIRVLYYEENKHFKYYLRYDVPWPLADRDLCVDACVKEDPVTGIREINAKPLPNLVPEQEGVVRITNYWQKWVIQPMDNGIIRITLEGSVDPGGSVPTWLINLVITDTPLNVMGGIKEKVEIK